MVTTNVNDLAVSDRMVMGIGSDVPGDKDDHRDTAELLVPLRSSVHTALSALRSGGVQGVLAKLTSLFDAVLSLRRGVIIGGPWP